MNDEDIFTDDLKKSLANIARTPEGLALYRWLQKRTLSFPTSADQGALLQHNGHRRLAADLMAFLAEGIDSGSTGSDTSGRPTERIVTFRIGQSAPVGKAKRGAARRVTLETRVPGWDRED